MKRILSTISLAVAVMLLAQIPAQAQVSCGFDRAAFSIENTTGVTLIYYVRWGGDSRWKKMILKSGSVNTHWNIIDGIMRTAPTPHVKFDRIGGDDDFTVKEYRMKFYAIDPNIVKAQGCNRSLFGRSSCTPWYVDSFDTRSKFHHGPDTCKDGFVWREARPGDHVCSFEPRHRKSLHLDKV